MWRVADDAAPHVVPLLARALALLLQAADTRMPGRAAEGAADSACTRHCLVAALHVLSRRHRALEAASADMHAVPVAVAQRVGQYLEAAAAGHVACVHAGDLRDMLDEFVDMQRVVRSPLATCHTRLLCHAGGCTCLCCMCDVRCSVPPVLLRCYPATRSAPRSSAAAAALLHGDTSCTAAVHAACAAGSIHPDHGQPPSTRASCASQGSWRPLQSMHSVYVHVLCSSRPESSQSCSRASCVGHGFIVPKHVCCGGLKERLGNAPPPGLCVCLRYRVAMPGLRTPHGPRSHALDHDTGTLVAEGVLF